MFLAQPFEELLLLVTQGCQIDRPSETTHTITATGGFRIFGYALRSAVASPGSGDDHHGQKKAENHSRGEKSRPVAWCVDCVGQCKDKYGEYSPCHTNIPACHFTALAQQGGIVTRNDGHSLVRDLLHLEQK